MTSTSKIITDPKTELEAYQQRVRRLAIQLATEEDWCMGTLNRALIELDLVPYGGEVVFEGKADILATVTVPPSRRDETRLTLETIGLMTQVVSSDPDVKVTEQRVTAFTSLAPSSAGVVTFHVAFKVTDTQSADTAEGWVEDSLQIVHRGFLDVSDIEISGVTISGDPDPDAPGSYE